MADSAGIFALIKVAVHTSNLLIQFIDHPQMNSKFIHFSRVLNGYFSLLFRKPNPWTGKYHINKFLGRIEGVATHVLWKLTIHSHGWDKLTFAYGL